MGKIKRAARVAPPRAAIASRAKSNEEHSNDSFLQKRGASRRATNTSAAPEKRSLAAGDEGILDEWLEPDEDADVDQWLHDHGAGADLDD